MTSRATRLTRTSDVNEDPGARSSSDYTLTSVQSRRRLVQRSSWRGRRASVLIAPVGRHRSHEDSRSPSAARRPRLDTKSKVFRLALELAWSHRRAHGDDSRCRRRRQLHSSLTRTRLRHAAGARGRLLGVFGQATGRARSTATSWNTTIVSDCARTLQTDVSFFGDGCTSCPACASSRTSPAPITACPP